MPVWSTSSLLGLVAGLSLQQLWRHRVPRLAPSPTSFPAPTYADARAKIDMLRDLDDEHVRPCCRTALFEHGQLAERAVLLLHGYTSCPQQFRTLAERMFRNGYNVLILRLPYHGRREKVPSQLGRMHASEVLSVVEWAADAIVGLGRHASVMGFSFGGVLAATIAQHRSDIDLALLVSSSFGIGTMTEWQLRLLGPLLSFLPDRFWWWDRDLRDKRPGPTYTYAGPTSRSVGTLVRLGVQVMQDARQAAPAAKEIKVVTNDSDTTVNNEFAVRVAEWWRAHGGHVQVHTFGASMGLLHDLMDPAQPGQRIDAVYPVLERLLASHG